jgi:hypothetical protein
MSAAPFPFDERTTPIWLREALRATPRSKSHWPGWLRLEQLPPLAVGAHRLNNDQLRALFVTLRKSTLAEPLPLVLALKRQASPTSLDAFAWRLFELWMIDRSPNRDKWVLTTLGLFGGNLTVVGLTPLLRAWPGQMQQERALVGLEILRAIGTDTALLHLSDLAQRLRYHAVRRKAQEMMEAVARDRGLSRDELEDRIVPALGLDERGSRTFDFGPRRFQLVFGDAMKPLVRDAAGKLAPDLPRPTGRDDPDKVTRALLAWSVLKAQVKDILRIQAGRLEQALSSCRRWTGRDFEALLVRHPLLVNLVRRLLWGGFDEVGRLARAFRVTEEREYVTEDDAPIGLDGFAAVGLLHPLHLTAAQLARWGEVFSDYELIAPFAQLSRHVHALRPDEAKQSVISRFNGTKVPPVPLLSILNKSGWLRDRPRRYDIRAHTKLFAGTGVVAVITYEPGVPGGYFDECEAQELTGAFFLPASAASEDEVPQPAHALPLSTIDRVVISEVLDVLAGLASRGT